MKRLIKHLALFIIPFIGVIFILDLYLRQVNTLYKEKINGLQHAQNTEILIFGNSHANYGVDPTAFERPAYNLAHPGQSIYFDYRIYDKYNVQLPKLNTVMISVDLHSLSFSSQRIANAWSYYAHGIKYKNEDYSLVSLSPFLYGYTPVVSLSMMRKLLSRKLRATDHNLIDFVAEEGVDITDSIQEGFIGYSGQNPKQFNRKWFRGRAGSFNKRIRNSSEHLEVLNDLSSFIRQVRRDGRRVVLFATPTYTEYNSLLDQTLIIEHQHIMDSLCQDRAVEFWNHAQDERFTANDFYNGDHLNKKGARKFGQILNNKLILLDSLP